MSERDKGVAAMPNGFITIDQYGKLPALRSGMPTSYFEFPDDIYESNSLLDQVRVFWIILKMARSEKVVMLSSSSIAECLAAAAFSTWRRSSQPIVILFGDMFSGRSRLKRWLLRVLLKVLDRAVDGYIVQSTDELTVFPRMWGVDASKVYAALFGYTFDEDSIDDAKIREGEYIFAGGNSQRDYDTLLEVARRMPERQFVFATRLLLGRDDIPPNVTAEPVSEERYQQLMQQSGPVITAINRGLSRAVGQQTYLNAMRLGKISIVNEQDVLGVRDYIEHGKTGILVQGTPESYVEALRWVFDRQNTGEVQRICRDAQYVVKQRFSYDHFLQRLSAAVDKIIYASHKPILKHLRERGQASGMRSTQSRTHSIVSGSRE
jgi:glycosyltransferase involved in cell wall biosynthesis